VARNWSGVVVASYISTGLLQVGKAIRFANGEIRRINRVKISGMYLNILLDSSALDGEKVGFPNKLEVIE
jgi:hypothetical protein